MQTGDQGQPGRGTGSRRRDRHGRGLRGVLVPPGVPLYRTRAQQFDDLVLEAVARLEPRWETELAHVEFAVEEIPPPPGQAAPGTVPLGRVESPAKAAREAAETPVPGPGGARIVVYRRPLMARADGEEDLGELVFEVVVEEFAHLLGVDPQDVDPDYPPED